MGIFLPPPYCSALHLKLAFQTCAVKVKKLCLWRFKYVFLLLWFCPQTFVHFLSWRTAFHLQSCFKLMLIYCTGDLVMIPLQSYEIYFKKTCSLCIHTVIPCCWPLLRPIKSQKYVKTSFFPQWMLYYCHSVRECITGLWGTQYHRHTSTDKCFSRI